jgi:ribonuclease HI
MRLEICNIYIYIYGNHYGNSFWFLFARAVVKAIELSTPNCLLHHKHIIIEYDSANLISRMNNPRNRPWLHHKLFSSFKRLVSRFGSITFTHSYHESNHMADHLAKQGMRRTSEFVAWI